MDCGLKIRGGGRYTKSIVGFGEWERLNHAVDVFQLREFDRFLPVERVAGRPGLDRKPIAKLFSRELTMERIWMHVGDRTNTFVSIGMTPGTSASD